MDSKETIIRCPKCKEDIQKDAKKCKHCGADLRNWFAKNKIITWLLVILILWIMWSSWSKNNTQTTNTNTQTTTKQVVAPKAIINISAPELVKAYEKNEVKADQDYKDKIANINWKIKDIWVVIWQTYVIISSGKEFSVSDIQCFFDEDSEIVKVSQLVKGNNISVQWKIDWKSINIGVLWCKII